MAVEPTPLERAVAAARADGTDDATWIELRGSVISRVRSLVRPAEPLLTHDLVGTNARDAQGSRTFVSSRVVLTALRRALVRPDLALSDLRLEVEDGRLVRVRVALVATYGAVLGELGEAARTAVLAQVRALLGADPDFGPDDVEVTVVDVVPGDPRTT